ncbi:MAG TPA: NAD-dependent epimerase/dehydratase family protein [Actinomycetota bacterium]
MGRRVLITGIAGHLAGMLARRLERDPDVEYVVGVDVDEPRLDLERLEFVRADIRNPLVVKVLQTTEVDTVVHLNLLATPAGVGGRSQMKEINVIGTMQLLAACQRAEVVRKLVMKSTTAVYGAGAKDPAVFTEQMSARSEPPSGYAKDSLEAEGYARGFARRRPDAALTILRFANFIGPNIHSSLTRYFSLPVVPTPLGFDPRLQLLHEDDAVEALYRAVREDHPGTYNVAADGVLYLSQALRVLGRPSIPILLPLALPVGSALRRFGLVDFSTDQLRLLVYGRVADNGLLEERFGFRPERTTREALEDFAASLKVRGRITPDRVAEWERDLYAFLRRKGQERFEKAKG